MQAEQGRGCEGQEPIPGPQAGPPSDGHTERSEREEDEGPTPRSREEKADERPLLSFYEVTVKVTVPRLAGDCTA